MPTKSETAAQFAANADAYVTSPGHAGGRDLERLVELLRPAPSMHVLDVATGGGHTAAAIAPHVRTVVASDLTAAMAQRAQELARSRGLDNVIGAIADVERLPFASAAFDAVTCRIAPHHFADLDAAIGEITRVVRPGGTFVVEDSAVPDDEEAADFLNQVEAWRDHTHVRSRSEKEWRAVLTAHGFRPAAAELHRKRHPLDAWFERAQTPVDDRARVIAAFTSAGDAIKRLYDVEFDVDGRPIAYSDDKVLIAAVLEMR